MRKRRTFFWKIYPSYLIIIVISLAAVTCYTQSSTRKILLERIHNELQSKAMLVASHTESYISPENQPVLDALCRELGEAAGARITIVAADGSVLGDSQESSAVMEPHGDRPEIKAALSGETGTSERYSETIHSRMLYVAVPIKHSGIIVGLARAALPLTEVEQSLRSISMTIVGGGAVVVILAAIIGLAATKAMTRPIESITRGAQHFAAGYLKSRLPLPDSQELATLSETLNNMAAELDARIDTIVRQSNEREAILGGMVEGVIAVDDNGRIITMNESARRMLETNQETAINRNALEALHNFQLQELITRAISSDRPIDADISVDAGSKVFQAQGAAIKSSDGGRLGAVIVLNDVTRVRRLENMRREFVANVSHELKTPVTSIVGFVETLLDGAIDDKEEARRFLSIIAGHADRLNAIIEDLLLLSKMEQSPDVTALKFRVTPLRGVLAAAIKACGAKAEDKNIDIELNCPDELMARVDSNLLFEQAVVNLIDNAIKYSEPGGVIEVSGKSEDGGVMVSVVDHGCGISAEDQPRVFERFYRVDKARSRKLGGTGLGLSIVKHIVQAHRGTVSLKSEPGKGSTFTIILPE